MVQTFPRLGLTDAALLEVVIEDTPLATVDLDPYLEALPKGTAARRDAPVASQIIPITESRESWFRRSPGSD